MTLRPMIAAGLVAGGCVLACGRVFAGDIMVTHTAKGTPGDPINVGLVGSRGDVLCAMKGAAWYTADPITPETTAAIVRSVTEKQPYPNAPVSDLFYNDARQDLAFEQPVGGSAERRHHVRYWLIFNRGTLGRSIWLGAASYDRGIKRTNDSRRVTHQIAPDLDAERDLLTAQLKSTKLVEKIYEVTGIGRTDHGRNGEGDEYYTDGDIKISALRPGCRRVDEAEAAPENPPSVAMKGMTWDEVAKAILLATR